MVQNNKPAPLTTDKSSKTNEPKSVNSHGILTNIFSRKKVTEEIKTIITEEDANVYHPKMTIEDDQDKHKDKKLYDMSSTSNHNLRSLDFMDLDIEDRETSWRRIRARKNWSILRQKIRDMKTEANWLVLYLDDKREMAR